MCMYKCVLINTSYAKVYMQYKPVYKICHKDFRFELFCFCLDVFLFTTSGCLLRIIAAFLTVRTGGRSNKSFHSFPRVEPQRPGASGSRLCPVKKDVVLGSL